MPELPEVETIVRGLKQQIVGSQISSVKVNLPKIINLQPETFISLVEGVKIQEVNRRGKIILINLSNEMSLLVHLKISGQLIYSLPEKRLDKHTHLVFDLSDGGQLRYVDVRQFGYLLLVKNSELAQLRQLNTVGYDSLKISWDDFKRSISKRKGRIKSLLLNQSFLAGIGNIYADEILHRARIHPLTLVQNLNTSRLKLLYQTIKEVLTQAIQYRGSSVADYLDLNGQKGSYQLFHQVYQRKGKPCFTCQNKIESLKINGRSSYFCPHCQQEK